MALRRAGALPLQARLERRSLSSCALLTHRELSFVFSLGASLPPFLPNQVTLQLHFRCSHELRTLSETFHMRRLQYTTPPRKPPSHPHSSLATLPCLPSLVPPHPFSSQLPSNRLHLHQAPPPPPLSHPLPSQPSTEASAYGSMSQAVPPATEPRMKYQPSKHTWSCSWNMTATSPG